jgi:tetratricopeptide (TPR) repeat protein
MDRSELQSRLEQALELRQKKKFRKARKLFEELASCDEPAVAARAQIELGKLQRRSTGILISHHGDTDAAIASYEKAAAAGDPESSPHAAFLLGELLLREEKRADAEAAFMQAIESGHPEWSSAAAMKLADMVRRDNSARAVALYQSVVDHGPSNLVFEAAYKMGQFYREQGHAQRAREYYARSGESGEEWYLRLPGPRENPDAILQRVVARIRRRTGGIPAALSDEDREHLVAAGEPLLIDATLVIGNSNDQPVSVILTDRRIQVGGFASDYGRLQMTTQRQGRSKTKTNFGTYTRTTTHYGFAAYTLVNAQSQKTVLQLIDTLDYNMGLANAIDEVTRCFIEPARAAAVVDLVRSGENTWTIRRNIEGDTSPLLSVFHDGFMVVIGGQQRLFPWAEQRRPVVVKTGRSRCLVRLRDGQDSTIASDEFAYSDRDVLDLVLSHCQYALC